MTNTTKYYRNNNQHVTYVNSGWVSVLGLQYNNAFTRSKKQKQIGMRLNLKNNHNYKVSVFFLTIIIYNNLPPKMSLKHL